MRKQKRVFHGGDCNAYFSSQVIAATLRTESCLPLHIITNKMSESQIERDLTQMLRTSLWELPMLHTRVVTSICIQTSGDV